MSWKNFYVYQYEREDKTPFYIGKGSKNRINESHSPWVDIPAPEYRKVIKEDLTEEEAFNLELSLIKHYGRKIDGGILDNIKLSRWVAQSGWNHSEETKKKISKSNTGKIRTDEQRENYKGKKTAKHAEKIRLANLGRPRDSRYDKIGLTMSLKRWYTDGHVSKMFIPDQIPEGFVPGRIICKNKGAK
jgi:hypothetical protein